jgi:hypothetical protein
MKTPSFVTRKRPANTRSLKKSNATLSIPGITSNIDGVAFNRLNALNVLNHAWRHPKVLRQQNPSGGIGAFAPGRSQNVAGFIVCPPPIMRGAEHAEV